MAHDAEHQHDTSGLDAMAASATLHCLTGCSIGEILGLVLGAALGLHVVGTIAISVGLAFVFGFALSSLPLLGAGLAVTEALKIVVAADTVSIAVMELVDNGVMAMVPGAMDAGLPDPLFWIGMTIALLLAFVAAFPVNRALLQRGKGHALTHEFHDRPRTRRVPSPSSTTLALVIAAFVAGALLVAIAG